jgi:hypothetical protein
MLGHLSDSEKRLPRRSPFVVFVGFFVGRAPAYGTNAVNRTASTLVGERDRFSEAAAVRDAPQF